MITSPPTSAFGMTSPHDVTECTKGALGERRIFTVTGEIYRAAIEEIFYDNIFQYYLNCVEQGSTTF